MAQLGSGWIVCVQRVAAKHRTRMVRIGTAGWVIPRQSAEIAAGEGSHLERYARVLNCVEINSSFYRSHRAATWERWAASTPDDFRFSVKLPKAITHEEKLAGGPERVDAFFAEVGALGKKLGVVLVQLPPKLGFGHCPAAEFFEFLRARWQGDVALEPRNASWFTDEADELMVRHRIGRVAADPARHGGVDARGVAQPGGWPGLTYFRLHGSPRMYYSQYEAGFLEGVAKAVRAREKDGAVWVVFDNTAAGHGFGDAVDLKGMM
jgi:uncharacterized protein YecE (DUF72 family)